MCLYDPETRATKSQTMSVSSREVKKNELQTFSNYLDNYDYVSSALNQSVVLVQSRDERSSILVL